MSVVSTREPYGSNLNENSAKTETLSQGWANYGLRAVRRPPSNFLLPTKNFSEVAPVVVGIFFGFAFPMQR